MLYPIVEKGFLIFLPILILYFLIGRRKPFAFLIPLLIVSIITIIPFWIIISELSSMDTKTVDKSKISFFTRVFIQIEQGTYRKGAETREDRAKKVTATLATTCFVGILAFCFSLIMLIKAFFSKRKNDRILASNFVENDVSANELEIDGQ